MSNNLDIDIMGETQVDKFATANAQVQQLDAAITENLSVDFASGNVTPTAEDFRRNLKFTAANLSVARSFTVPDDVAGDPIKHLFIVDNTAGTAGLTVTVGTTTVVLSAGDNGIFYTDGTTNGLLQVAGGGGGGGNTDELAWKQPVVVATTQNGALATAYENGDTVDGVTLATGDRILLKDQTTGSENGIYTVNATGAPTRATDFDAASKVTGGAAVYVQEGTDNGEKTYELTNTGTVTPGTTAMTFELAYSASPPYDVGGSFGGAMAASEVILYFVVPRPITMVSGGGNSEGYAGTTDTVVTNIDMQQNGTSFGTMSFAASTATATFTVSSDTSFAAGDRIELVGPATTTLLADIAVTLAFTRD